MTARKRRLARSIQNLQQELEEEKKRTITEMAHVGRTVGVTERRLSVLEHLRAENWELIRLTTSLSEGLSRAIDEYTAARSRFERLLEELGQIMAETREQQRVLDELASRLADVSNLYTKMKLERNKCVSLLQASVKMALDTRERLRIHANEAEIIIYRLQRHDQELIHERTLFGNAIVQRDHKRNEVCKMLHIHSEQIARREQMRRSIHRINLMFNQTESETLSLKKAKERCAQMRNERAILLIERNQEVYILQERIAAQDAAARYAGLTLRAMREECEFLRRYRNHLSRYIWVVNNKIPVHQNLTTKLHGLIHELVGSRMELARLVEQAEDPDIPGRLRLLGGKDPSQNELWITLGKLERRMAAKEEDMAEKNLTYEAVCRLVDSLQVRATAGKEDTLTLATEVNKIKARLLYMRNQMKTIYAELVVCGAERNDLKQQVLNLEKKLDVYNLRMRLGHAPSPTLERKLRSNMRIARLKQVGRCGEPIAIQPMRLPGTMPNKPFDSMVNDHRKSTSSDTRPVRGKPTIQRVEREGSAAKLRRSSHGSGRISQDVHLPPITNMSGSRMTNESQENRTANENQSNMNLSNIMTVLPALGSSQLALNRNLSRSQTSTWRAYKNGVNVRSGEENMEVDRPSSTPFSSSDVTMSEENFDHSETDRNDQEASLEHIVLSCRIQSPTRESSLNDGRMNTPENSQLKPPGRVESPEHEH
ncbi:Coiled coil domain containing protein [Fasciola gigantica]|uniref:Coiled coil domain containing protein n=1 Tax=Fasciola gigantica TaxID=46835 RepID=A0A504YGT9_FASGI|nr:Coiled coil domain containing protein [Fasciola gigantica]